jgi:hypothetical protein
MNGISQIKKYRYNYENDFFEIELSILLITLKTV